MSASADIVELADALVYSKTGQHLNDLQRFILRESWQETKKNYDQMAHELGYSESYIKQSVAPQLWRMLSQGLEEKVTKTSVRSVLERRLMAPNKLTLKAVFNDNELGIKSAKAERSDQAKSSPTPLIQPSGQTILPTVDLELPDGSVPLNSPFYIERVPYEAQCYRELLKPGTLIRIKGPRQIGKTSLVHRLLSRGIANNYKTVVLDFQQVEETVISDLNKMLRWLCASLTRQLKLESRLNDYWDEDLGSKMSCALYIREYILAEIDQPIVLVLEELSLIFQQVNIVQEFLTLLRSWHEQAKVDPIWQRLRLVLIQSTEVYVPLNINQSPFNVGLGVDLEPLSREQVQDLTWRHGLSLEAEQITQMMQLVGGHPYLIRLTLYHLARQDFTFEQILKTAATETGIYANHLHRHLWTLQHNPELATAFNQVLSTTEPIEVEQVQGFKLHSMGLVTLEGNQVRLSCDLYRYYFRDRIIKCQDADSE
ncbi:MAG: AAA-like domain-containing protein [Coleofasciculus sp. C1-SOL-03]|uniref:AAA-like domain-containing protein n=1 Tax=Coleofasciculus sp. C1-SOL-03 TaxID=3069522 RepID=UPI00330197E3